MASTSLLPRCGSIFCAPVPDLSTSTRTTSSKSSSHSVSEITTSPSKIAAATANTPTPPNLVSSVVSTSRNVPTSASTRPSASTSDGPYFTYYIYQEPLVTNSITSWTLTKIPETVYNNWMQAMSTAIPFSAFTAYGNDENFVNSLDHDIAGTKAPSWFKTMQSDAQSVLVSFWIPRHDPGNIATTSAPLSEYNSMFPPESQAHMLDLEHLNTSTSGTSTQASGQKAVSHKIAIGISIPFAAVLIFLFLYLIFRLRARYHQHHQDVESSPNPPSKNRIKRTSYHHKRDYNAPPLYPHKPLPRLSETTFSTTDPGPSSSHRSMADNDIPNLPELEGSPTEESQLLLPGSSDDDFGTHFSGLEDPFSEGNNILAELPSPSARMVMTPGVSPSTYPLRDRLGRDGGRRRKAIESIASGSPGRRSSVGEGELRRLGREFERCGEVKGLRGSRSMDDVAGSASSKEKGGEREEEEVVSDLNAGRRNVEEAIRTLMNRHS